MQAPIWIFHKDSTACNGFVIFLYCVSQIGQFLWAISLQLLSDGFG